jgi:nucleoid DNA-binding protein
MPKITQSKFTEILAARMKKTVSETAYFLDAFKSQVYELLNEGNAVELSGMGQFSVSHRNPREGFNPRTHNPITIRELNTPKFKAGEAFKKAVALRY